MRLLRLKITDPNGFRSLQAGFECYFRRKWDLQDEEAERLPLPFATPHFGISHPAPKGLPPFAPFVCAGPNGSGKSNLLEALAAIFYHLECIYLENLPDSFIYDENSNPNGFCSNNAFPDGFEIEYLIYPKDVSLFKRHNGEIHVRIDKQPGQSPKWHLLDSEQSDNAMGESLDQTMFRHLLPQYILGYSSGENEILSLPFFKMRFVQFDEYSQALRRQFPYPGRPESRLVYLDSSFSLAILLCNLLFLSGEEEGADGLLDFFSEDVKIGELKEFRIIIRRSIEVDESQIPVFGSQDKSKRETIEEIVENHPALTVIDDGYSPKRYRVNLVQLLDDVDDPDKSDKIIPCLKRCATCWYLDEHSDTLFLDYRVDAETRKAFGKNFDFEVNRSPIALFQAFQVLLTLNLYSVNDMLKSDLYGSDSQYVSETVPLLASEERIMRFEFVKFSKSDVDEPLMLKSLSDGEHQMLHAMGLCSLFRNTQSLFLLDEPETHLNPDWRANFITRLRQSFKKGYGQEMLITTHSPFLISDSKKEKVLVFKKEKGVVSVHRPDYNTFGASISKITISTFGKLETIGRHAQDMLEEMRDRYKDGGEDPKKLLGEIEQQLGDSVEKVLLQKVILDGIKE